MFTGLIEETGTVKSFRHKANLAVLDLKAKKVLAGTKVGDSIAVNGVCLTVTAKTGSVFSFDLMKETLCATNLGLLQPGDQVNLERALKLNDRMGGHFVTGHVDGVGKILKKVKEVNYIAFALELPAPLMKYIVPKGSICVDGVSLTVGKVTKKRLVVYMIPLTLKLTTFASRKAGDAVNIETDLLAKYALNQGF